MNSDLPDFIEINPSADPVAAIIWLHGLGADGHDLAAIVSELRLPASLPVRHVLPHAPRRAVTINGGMVMRAWFDIYDFDLTADSVDPDQFLESADLLEALIANERQSGMASQRIVLAGFSQGGAIVLHSGLLHPEPLAGILALSMHLPSLPRLAPTLSPANRQVPIMIAHGQADQVIPLVKAIETRQALTGLGYAVDWHEYPIPHTLCAEEIDDIRVWLLKVLT